MRRRSVLFCLMVVVVVNVHFSYAVNKARTAGGSSTPSAGNKQPKSVNGNTSPSHFPIAQDYCDDRSAYSYSASHAPVAGEKDEDAPTKSIPDLGKFGDNGDSILTNPSSKFPLADGSDSSRLLVRAFSAGTCSVRLSIAPASVSIPAGQRVEFVPVWRTGTEKPQFDTRLVWTINPDDSKGTYGRMEDGFYTAPPNVPDTKTITVTATSKSNSSFSASAQVTITSAGLLPFSLIPSQVSVREGDTVQFTLLNLGPKWPVLALDPIPTDGGKGYTKDDVGQSLTITTGNGEAKVSIADVNDSGAVTKLDTRPTAPGGGYSVGPGQATSGGHGKGCTVHITELNTVKFTSGAPGRPLIDAEGLFTAPLLTPDNSGKKTPMKVTVTAALSTGTTAPPATVTVTPAFNLLDNQYYVINIVRWKRQDSFYQANSNEWYIFNTSDKSVVHQSPFGVFHPNVLNASDTRVFGSNKVVFLAVHLRSEDISQQDFKSLHINYNVSATQIQPMNVQDVQALLQLIGIGAAAAPPGAAARAFAPPPPAPPTPIGLYGGGPLTNGLGSLPAKVTFEADVSFPSNASATKNAAPPGGSPSPAPTDQTTGKSTTPPACDSTPGSSSKTQASCTLTQSVTDEGLHRWDVSAGVPFNALNQYSFASTDGTVTQKSNAKLNAYGFFDLYPFHGADLAGPPWSSYPHLMVGLPFSGKVFNRPFVGMGFLHLKQLPVVGKFIPLQANLYAGWVIEKEFKPKTLTVGSPATVGALANDLRPERDWKPQFGIEFSIRSLKKAAASSTSKQGTGSSSKQATGGTKSQ